MQIVPQVLSGDSSSFNFGSGTTQTATTAAVKQAPASGPILAQRVDPPPEVLTQSQNPEGRLPIVNVLSMGPNDWDKLMVVDGGIRLPLAVSN